jgi:tetratricopeptide (TPR) repeat protein
MRSLIALALCLCLVAALSGNPPKASDAKPTLAVLYFQNTKDDKEYDWLRKGFADMLITELVSLDAWRIVERERLQDVWKELKLGLAGAVDEATAQKVGRLVGAQNILQGSYFVLGDAVQIDLHIVEVESGEVRKSASLHQKVADLLSIPALMARKVAELTGASFSEKSTGRFGKIDTSKLFYKAMESYDSYKMDEALDYLNQALALEPENARVNFFLGDIYVKKMKAKKGLQCLEKAAALDPENPKYHFVLGKSLLGFYPFDYDKKKRAIAELETVTRLSPRDDQAYVQLGFAWQILENGLYEPFGKGKITELEYWERLYGAAKNAMACYRKAIEIEPDNIQAEQALDIASSNLPRDGALAARRCAVIYLKAGDYGKASGVLTDAATWHPDYGETYYLLGRALKGGGDAKAARRAWERYLQEEPKGEYAEEVRKELGK